MILACFITIDADVGLLDEGVFVGFPQYKVTPLSVSFRSVFFGKKEIITCSPYGSNAKLYSTSLKAKYLYK